MCVSSPKGFDAGQCETVMDVAIQREALKGDVRAVAIGDNLIAAGASNVRKLMYFLFVRVDLHLK